MKKNRLDRIYNFLSKILKHDPDFANIKLYDNFKCKIADILKLNISFDELQDFLKVYSNDFEHSLKEGWLRAKEGHTTVLESTLTKVNPPNSLFFSYEVHKDNNFIFNQFDMKYPSKGEKFCRLYPTSDQAALSKRHLGNDLIITELHTTEMIKDYNFYQIDKEVFDMEKQSFVKVENEYDIAIIANKLNTSDYFGKIHKISFSNVMVLK